MDILYGFICKNPERLLGGILSLWGLLHGLWSNHLLLDATGAFWSFSMLAIYWIFWPSTWLPFWSMRLLRQVILRFLQLLLNRAISSWVGFDGTRLIEQDLTFSGLIITLIMNINDIIPRILTAVYLINWWKFQSMPIWPFLIVLHIVRIILLLLIDVHLRAKAVLFGVLPARCCWLVHWHMVLWV